MMLGNTKVNLTGNHQCVCLSPATFSCTGAGLGLGGGGGGRGGSVGFQQTGFVTGEYSEVNGRMSKACRRVIKIKGHGIPSYRQINLTYSTTSLLV